MIRGAIKKLMKKYGGRISDKDRAAGMQARNKSGSSAERVATASRKKRLKKNIKGTILVGGATVATGAVLANAQKIDTKEKAEMWFNENAPDATPAERRKFSKKYFGVNYN